MHRRGVILVVVGAKVTIRRKDMTKTVALGKETIETTAYPASHQTSQGAKGMP